MKNKLLKNKKEPIKDENKKEKLKMQWKNKKKLYKL